MSKNIEIIGNQKGQHDFISDFAPGWVLFEGGLGAGKTWAGARKFLLVHSFNNCPGLIVAPTFGDLFRFCVAEIKSACDEWGWPCKIEPKGKGEIPFPHLVVWGQIIYLLSAEDPKRFAGFQVGHIWIDEGARIKQNLTNPLMDAPTQIRTRLRHPNAQILIGIVTGTPEGDETWIQDKFVDNPESNHRRYEGATEGNSALPQEYIDDLKRSLPAHLLDQYLRGRAANLAIGVAHPTFNDENISELADWLNLPVHIGMDFNVSPMAWVAMQDDGRHIHVVDELWIEDFALVDDGMEAIKEKGWGSGRIIFHPDKASKNRKTSGDPEFTVIKQKARSFGWNWGGTDSGANPGVNQRINNLSRLICNGVGERKLLVHPRCTRLIDDLRKVIRKGDGYHPGQKGHRGHICFTKGTKILTTKGERDISIINQSDELVSHIGATKIIGKLKTSRVETYRLALSDNRHIIGTKDHPMLTTSGWVPLGECEGKTLLCLDQFIKETKTDSRRQNSKASNTQETKTQLCTAIGISWSQVSQDISRVIDYIEDSGLPTLGRYRRGLMYIIEIMTREIVTRKTSWYCQDQNMQNCTQIISRKHVEKPANGMDQKLEKNGILSMVKEPGKTEKREIAFVPNAVQPSDHLLMDQCTVQSLAYLLQGVAQELMTSREHADIANQIFQLTAIVKRSIAPDHAQQVRVIDVKLEGINDVYSLRTIDGTYIANGLIVSNCDALGYAVWDIAGPVERVKIA